MRRPREKNPAHLRFIRSLMCCIPGCGNDIQTEAAHIRRGNIKYDKRQTGLGERPSDCWTLPLCGAHHRLEQRLREKMFWGHYGIDPFDLARQLFAITGDHEAGTQILNNPALNK